jgi:hypothetical protein
MTMAIQRFLLLTLLVIALGGATAWGEEWRSADGAVAVAVPDPARFIPMEMAAVPADVLGGWVSTDETLRLVVVKMSIPPNVNLIRKEADQGLAKELDGPILASTTEVRNGHEIWIMTAKGTHQGTKMQVTQAIAPAKETVYKVFAATSGGGPPDAAAIDAFINSFQILSAESSDTAPAVAKPNAWESGEIARNVGSATGLLILILLAWFVLGRRSKKRPA